MLSEAAKSPDELPEHWRVIVKDLGDSFLISLVQLKENKWEPVPGRSTSFSSVLMSKWQGLMGLKAPCLDAYVISHTAAAPGWGPFLYDIALELAGEDGLMPDRQTVSEEALRVWKYYQDNRPDITWKQLDDLFNSLTPEEKDNCLQDSAEDWSSDDWPRSPLSKVYYKQNTDIINKLVLSKKIILVSDETIQEDFQQDVKRGHSRHKKRLIGLGGNKNVPPYTKRPGFKRSKSAPPGFGGS